MTHKILIGAFIAVLTAGGAAFAEGRAASFETLDTNGDGALSKTELEAAGAARFAAADANGDGALSKEELQARASSGAAKRVERMMTRLDTDGDGKLTQAELEARPRRGDVFARLDADNDGAISKAEFEEGRAKMRKRRGHGG